MPKKEHSITAKRDALLKYLLDKNASSSIILQIVAPFDGQTDEEKEVIAEKLLNAIEGKETPEEMLKAAQALNL